MKDVVKRFNRLKKRKEKKTDTETQMHWIECREKQVSYLRQYMQTLTWRQQRCTFLFFVDWIHLSITDWWTMYASAFRFRIFHQHTSKYTFSMAFYCQTKESQNWSTRELVFFFWINKIEFECISSAIQKLEEVTQTLNQNQEFKRKYLKNDRLPAFFESFIFFIVGHKSNEI